MVDIDLGSDQKRKAQLEKAIFTLWLNEMRDVNSDDVIHLKNCIRVAVKECLSKKQRLYLSMYMNGYNQTEIAEKYGVSKSAVSRTIGRALDNVFDHVKYANPITLKINERVRRSVIGLYR